MKCSCPKCEALIETVFSEVSASGKSQQCPTCNDKYWVAREEFALRAYKKQGKIYCFDCGHELGHESLCLNCGSCCPDYCIVQATKPVARKQAKAGFDFKLTRRPKPAKSAPLSAARSIPEAKSEDATQKKTSRRGVAYVAIAMFVLVLVGGLGKLYTDYQFNKQYSRAFIVALYGIKTGTDFSLEQVSQRTKKWQSDEGVSSNVTPRINPEDLERMEKIKKRVDGLIAGLGETPGEFANAKSNLVSLHNIYEKIYALSVSSPSTPEAFTDSANKLETNFFKTANGLKKSMPPILMDELVVSVNKYKNLEVLIKNK